MRLYIIKTSQKQRERDEWWYQHFLTVGREFHAALDRGNGQLTEDDKLMLLRLWQDRINARKGEEDHG